MIFRGSRIWASTALLLAGTVSLCPSYSSPIAPTVATHVQRVQANEPHVRFAQADKKPPETLTWAADCNSAESARVLSGCSALIKQGNLKQETLAIAYSRRSDAYIEGGNFDQAIADRAKAAELQPNDAAHKKRLSLGYQLRAAKYFKDNKEAKALADYTEAIRVDSTNHSAFAARSSIQLAKQDFDKAVSDLETAVHLEPNIETYRLWLASLYERRGIERQQKRNYEAAIKDYSGAIQLVPSDASFFTRRAEVYVGIAAYDSAIKDLSEAIRLNPKSTSTYIRRAELYRETKDLDRALGDLDKALTQDEKSVPALLQRGLIHEETAKNDLALADYQAVLKIDRDNDVANKSIKRLSPETTATEQEDRPQRRRR
jgi:tetratricopeptide (TPR) repeat protein